MLGHLSAAGPGWVLAARAVERDGRPLVFLEGFDIAHRFAKGVVIVAIHYGHLEVFRSVGFQYSYALA